MAPASADRVQARGRQGNRQQRIFVRVLMLVGAASKAEHQHHARCTGLCRKGFKRKWEV